MEQFAFDLSGACKRVVMNALPESAFVDIRGVEARCGEHVGIHSRSKHQMSADANPHCAEPAVQAGCTARKSRTDRASLSYALISLAILFSFPQSAPA